MPFDGRAVAGVVKRSKRDPEFRRDAVDKVRGASYLRLRRGQYVHVKELCILASLEPRPNGVATLADAVGMLYRVVKEPVWAADLSEFFSVEANVESFAKTVLLSAPMADPLVRQLKFVRRHVPIHGIWKKLSVFSLAGFMMGGHLHDRKSLLSTFALLSVCRPSEIDVVMFANMLHLGVLEWPNVCAIAPRPAVLALRSILDGCECKCLALHIARHVPTLDVVVQVCAKFDLIPGSETIAQLVGAIRGGRSNNAVLDSVLYSMPSVDVVKLWAPDGAVESAMVERARSGDSRVLAWLTARKPLATHGEDTVDKLVDQYRSACATASSQAELASLTRRITLDPVALEAALDRWEASVGVDAPTCPLTFRPIVEPLVDAFGRSFERLPLLAWVARSGTHPLTREPVTPGHFTPGDQIS